MTQTVEHSNSSVAESEAVVSPAEIAEIARRLGARLTEARLARQGTLDEAASRLKVSVSKLEAIEAGEIDKLPDLTFTRALIRSYARWLNVDLGLDIQKLVNNQNPTFAEREIPTGGLNVPSGIPGRLSTFKPLLIAAGALIVIMAAFAGVRAFNRPAPEQMADVASQADAPSAAIATNLPPLVQAASDPIVALANAGSASVANASGVSGVLAASDVAPASGAKAKGKSTVRLQFIAETWYQIKDDNGEMLVKGVAKAGTSITSLPGKPPLKVLVGNAMAVSSVELNGVAVSLGERQRNENLRLTLSE